MKPHIFHPEAEAEYTAAAALRLISDYRTRLAGIRAALTWGKGMGENCRVSRKGAEAQRE